MLPVLEALATFLTVVRDLQSNPIRVAKENGVIIRRIFGIKLRRGTFDSQLAKLPGNPINGGAIFHPETKVVQSCSQRAGCGFGLGGPQHIAEMAVVILNVKVTLMVEGVLLEAEQGHDLVVVFFGPCELADRDVNMVDADHFDFHKIDLLSAEACRF